MDLHRTATRSDTLEERGSRGRPGGDTLKLAGLLIGEGTAGRARIIEKGRELGRTQARREAGRLAAGLTRCGLRAGHKVLALLDHDVWGFYFLAAASAIGAHVFMPYNLRSAAILEWKAIVASAQPDLVVHLKNDTGEVPELRALGTPLVTLADLHSSPGPAEPDDVGLRVEYTAPVPGFLVLFSSGTTGAPKAISISEDLVVRRVRSVTAALGLDADSRAFMSGLLNNTTGVIFCFGAMLHDATLVFPDSHDVADWPARIAEHSATHVMLRPVAMRRFLEAAEATGADLSSLRTVAYGAAAMPTEVLEHGRRLVPCDWVQGYGLSETYGPFCWLDEEAHAQRRYLDDTYCVGRPDDTLEVRIGPVTGHPDGIGEVLIRGENLMDGYLDVQTGQLSGIDGDWLRTGDLGRWNAEGDLVLKGRMHATVLSENGHRIYPEEVEATLARMPGIDTVVVVGLDNADHSGQLPVACISGPLGTAPLEEVRTTVVGFLATTLSTEKWPDYLHVTANPFPVSANGKVARAEVTASVTPADLIRVSGLDPADRGRAGS